MEEKRKGLVGCGEGQVGGGKRHGKEDGKALKETLEEMDGPLWVKWRTWARWRRGSLCLVVTE